MLRGAEKHNPANLNQKQCLRPLMRKGGAARCIYLGGGTGNLPRAAARTSFPPKEKAEVATLGKEAPLTQMLLIPAL